ncbi:MRC1-like domain-containing protein [Ampelomyces quisqualis]|uniref:MRC1-like domain-containing protein n=1 Tax=Ampelomyces quisqualis TaxID=50730 RepID=A0A6A5Q4Z7_AMPQU|nr:MRC1-like domain-containing protein [Ampelomyces quisqualis]
MDSSVATPVEQPRRTPNASTKPRTGLLAALRKPTTTSSESSAESEDSASESDLAAPASKPRASPKNSSPRRVSEPQSDEEEDDDNGAAYERMKKRLAASKGTGEANQMETTQNDAPVAAAILSGEDEDEMPVKRNARVPMVRKAPSNNPPVSPAASVPSRRSSPGLFVTPNASPEKSRIAHTTESDDDESRKTHSADLQARIQRIRADRLAKKKEEEQTQQKGSDPIRRRVQQDSGSDTDGENGRCLTQQAKPTRKAGKKAMELMARDQQRISRNMQLTHQTKTRKKYGLDQLFSRFAYNAPNAERRVMDGLPTPDASSALASSDAEVNQSHETPPTSPPMQEEQTPKEAAASAVVDKGKGRAPEFQHLPPHPWTRQTEPATAQNAQVDATRAPTPAMVELSDSEDDVEIVQPATRFPVFDRIPLKKQQESSSLLHLRHLAHLTSSNDSRKGPKSVTRGEMHLLLAQKAREQGQKERAEKLADLKRRGIHIETEEEREKNEMEIEDMVAQFEKQRQEDLKLAKSERAEAKKNGENVDELPSDDESDDDYVGSGAEDTNDVETGADLAVELELSGSEDEEMELQAEDEDAEDEESCNNLAANMADEDVEDEREAGEEQQVEEGAAMEDEVISVPVRRRTVARSRNVIVDEEDDSDNDIARPASPTQQVTQNDAMTAFGFGNANVGMGLTQMFAGTMANLESGSQPEVAEPDQNSLDFLRSLPDTQPGANFSQASDFLVPNSQSLMSPQKESQTGAETQFSLGISQLMKTSPAFSRTQLEDFPEPTQDAGFSFSRSPVGLMPPPSTIDTVMVSISESPVKQHKGRLQRGRRDAAVELSHVDEDLEIEAALSEEGDIQLPPKPRDAFSKLQKGAKKQKAVDDFNKKTSLAKEAVMDQAEESEDEYAGLGGASDDDSGDEDEDTKNMIEHGEVDVDERQIAAFFAEKAKKEDEKNINELYKNVMNGGLRRRAGVRDGFDMSDSEDEEDMRLRKKRAEFQKMNKALLADERIGDIAKDQKKQAFFHTLADFADEGDYDFLEMPAEMPGDLAQSPSQEGELIQGEAMEEMAIPDSQVGDAMDMSSGAATNPLKRKSPSKSQKENRPPPNLRRTAESDNLRRKPITLADVQHSVSELLEDPRIMVPDSQFSESEDDGDDPPAPNAGSRKPIVDRLTLSRTRTISEAAADCRNLAFHAPSRGATAPGFRVPSLIRQATSSLSSTCDSRRSSGAGVPSDAVRRGGTGKSNIHAQAREAERRQLLEKREVKRKEALRKKVSAGRKGGMRSVLGDLAGGFE